MTKLKEGLTLIEVVISMAILGFVIGMILFLLNLKMREAVRERGYAFMSTEIQLATEIITWDLWMEGFGLQSEVYPLVEWENVGLNGSDSVKLRAVAFITEPNRWTYTIKKTRNSDTLFVYRWDNPEQNIDSSENIIILMGNKDFVAGPLQVEKAKDTVITLGGQAHNVRMLKVSSTIPIINTGYLVFVVNTPLSTYTEITYKLRSDETLLRSGNEVLKNVRLFKVDFGVDTLGDGNITWLSTIPAGWTPTYLRDNLKLIQFSLIIHSPRKDRDYTYPSDVVTVATPDTSIVHTLNLTSEDRHYHWMPLTLVVKPRNLFR